jgi:hypothetical protein
VEHFFRHEFGRFCAVLTRSLGVRRLDLVEDVVQAALVQALETWSRRGVPEDPADWLSHHPQPRDSPERPLLTSMVGWGPRHRSSPAEFSKNRLASCQDRSGV